MNVNKYLYIIFFFFFTPDLFNPVNITVQQDIFVWIDVQPCSAFEIPQHNNYSDLNFGYESGKQSKEGSSQTAESQKKEDTKSGPFRKFTPTKKIPAEQAVDFPMDI